MLPELNPRFDAFVAPARRYPQLWRLIAGIVVGIVFYLGFVLGLILLATRAGLDPARALSGDGSPLESSLLLFSFAGMSGGVLLAARLFHKRGWASLVGPDLVEAWRYFRLSSTIVFAIMIGWTALGIWDSPPTPNLPFGIWLVWLPSSLILVLLQTGSEELVFRGYLQQQLAARFRSRWIWWLVPSALFGLAHLDREVMGPNAWLVVADTFLIGLVAADLTARTGNLGAAIGLHFTNNAMVLLFVAMQGNLSGLSLNVTTFSLADTAMVRQMLLIDLGVIVLLYSAYLVILQRRKRL